MTSKIAVCKLPLEDESKERVPFSTRPPEKSYSQRLRDTDRVFQTPCWRWIQEQHSFLEFQNAPSRHPAPTSPPTSFLAIQLEPLLGGPSRTLPSRPERDMSTSFRAPRQTPMYSYCPRFGMYSLPTLPTLGLAPRN